MEQGLGVTQQGNVMAQSWYVQRSRTCLLALRGKAFGVAMLNKSQALFRVFFGSHSNKQAAEPNRLLYTH